MRTTGYVSRGLASNAVEHGFLLKPVVGNPFVHTTHDGSSTGYLQGFQSKGKMDPVARFRFNLLPDGFQTGFFSRNPYGKYIHYYEVSTITKMKTQIFGEEAIPMTALTIIVVSFTVYQLLRLLFMHPDVSLYNFMLYPSKQWVAGWRAFTPPTIEQRAVRYMHRAPEFYFPDLYRDLVATGVIANDPVFEKIKAAGFEKELLRTANEHYYAGNADILGAALAAPKHDDGHGHH